MNCAYCHQSGGTAAPSAWDGRPHLTLDQTGLLFGNASNNGGDPQNKLVIPGDLPHSILLNRVAVTNGFTRMPPLGSSEPDQTNIALLTDWIGSALPQRQAYDQWRTAKFGSPSSPEGSPTADPDFDGHSNLTEFLTRTEPLSGADFLSVGSLSDGQSLSLTFDVPPNRSAWVESSADGAAWSRWDVPGNHALPATGGPVTLTGPIAGGRQYFRVRIQEN